MRDTPYADLQWHLHGFSPLWAASGADKVKFTPLRGPAFDLPQMIVRAMR